MSTTPLGTANINHKLNSIPSTPLGTPVEISNEWTADSTNISREQAIAIERINTPDITPVNSPDRPSSPVALGKGTIVPGVVVVTSRGN